MDYLNLIERNLKFYDSIKPKNPDNTYTVLASINEAKSGQLLALATGTQAGLKVYPDDIEDCHAESLVKRAFKRHLLDRLLNSIDDQKIEQCDLIKTKELINKYQLILFVSQFPCGLSKRYQGEELIDEETGAIIERKPGRGQEKDGKVVYVQRGNCLTKLKRWITTSSFQGKQLGQTLGLNCKISHILIGDCEQFDSEIDYTKSLENFLEQLNAEQLNIICTGAPIRRNDFIFEPSSKQPQPVAMVWWQKQSSNNGECEFLVDGRKIGLTKKQCQSENNASFKLKIGDYWLKKDLSGVIQSLK